MEGRASFGNSFSLWYSQLKAWATSFLATETLRWCKIEGGICSPTAQVNMSAAPPVPARHAWKDGDVAVACFGRCKNTGAHRNTTNRNYHRRRLLDGKTMGIWVRRCVGSEPSYCVSSLKQICLHLWHIKGDCIKAWLPYNNYVTICIQINQCISFQPKL